jgi:hypothetical protein
MDSLEMICVLVAFWFAKDKEETTLRGLVRYGPYGIIRSWWQWNMRSQIPHQNTKNVEAVEFAIRSQNI